ncbi:MAG TPA: DUF2283 domain-containing protein [Jatrophihabitans sp.]|jgi:uncharacterized protein YuzE|uniref:DUF2283 domain-containing protein n=1 Tax=Jatrophihabitans sp. TaxID=1932789 RepID=UPI002EF0E9D9
MRIEYGPREDIASMTLVARIPDGAITEDVHIERPGADIYLGFSASGHLLEVEILAASVVLEPETLAMAEPMDEEPTRRE